VESGKFRVKGRLGRISIPDLAIWIFIDLVNLEFIGFFPSGISRIWSIWTF